MRVFSNKLLSTNQLPLLTLANNEGWLDGFSDDNFLIKCLNNKLDYFDEHSNLIGNSPYFNSNIQSCNTFLFNFSRMLGILISKFGKDDVKKFFKHSLIAGGKNYSDEQFFRAYSEIVVIEFLLKYNQVEKCIYEPKLGVNGSNPEARLICEDGVIVDIEVKTPGFKKEESTNTIIPAFILDDDIEHEFKEIAEKHNLNYVRPRVLKLKDFINSAGKKFEKPKSSKHINLLYINWTYSDIKFSGFKEPYGLLYNNLNGILKNKDFALRLGIEEEALEKITAIIIYQDSFDSLLFGDFRDVWNGYKFRLLPNQLIDSTLIDKELLFKITGMNPPVKGDHLAPYLLSYSGSKENCFLIADMINSKIQEKISKLNIDGFEDNFIYFNKDFWEKTYNEQMLYFNQFKDCFIPQDKNLNNVTAFISI